MTTDDGAHSDRDAAEEPESALASAPDDDGPSIEETMGESNDDELTPDDMRKTLRRDSPQDVDKAREMIAEALAGSEVLEAMKSAKSESTSDSDEPRPKLPSVPPRAPPLPAAKVAAGEPAAAKDRRPLPPPRSLRPAAGDASPPPPAVVGELEPPTERVDRDSSEELEDADLLEEHSDRGDAPVAEDSQPAAGPPGIPSLVRGRDDSAEGGKKRARRSSAGKRKRGSRRRHRRTLRIPDDEVPATPLPGAVEETTAAAEQDQDEEPEPEDKTEAEAEALAMDEADSDDQEPGRTRRDTLIMDEVEAERAAAGPEEPEADASDNAPEDAPVGADPAAAESEELAAAAAKTKEIPVFPAGPPPPAPPPVKVVSAPPPPPQPAAPDQGDGDLSVPTIGVEEMEAEELDAEELAAEELAAEELEAEELAAEELESDPDGLARATADDEAAATTEPEPITVEPEPDSADGPAEPAAAEPAAAEPQPETPAEGLTAATAAAEPPREETPPTPAVVAAPEGLESDGETPTPVADLAAVEPARAEAVADEAAPPDAAPARVEPDGPATPPTEPAAADAEAAAKPDEDATAAPAQDEPPEPEREPPPTSEPPPTGDRAPLGVVTDHASIGMIMPIQISSDLPAMEAKAKKPRPVPPRRRDRPADPPQDLEELELEPLGPEELGLVDDGVADATAGPVSPSQPPGADGTTTSRRPPPPRRARARRPDGTEAPEELEPFDDGSGAAPTPSPPPAATTPSPPPAASAPAAEAPTEPKTPKRKAPKRKKSWWVDLFEGDFQRTFDPPTAGDVEREMGFVERCLRLERGARILDLGCGMGHHAVELSTRGYEVVGVDLSPAMLAAAADHAIERGQRVNFVKGDMRKLALESVFDGVYCWSTTFGYFDEQTNISVIESIHRALRPGGTIALDVSNRDFIAPRSPTMVWFQQPGCVCMDEMKFDFFTSRMIIKRMVLFETGKSKEIEYSIRLYGLHELGRILHQAGFKVLEVSGHRAHRGAFFGSESPRIIVAAERM